MRGKAIHVADDAYWETARRSVLADEAGGSEADKAEGDIDDGEEEIAQVAVALRGMRRDDDTRSLYIMEVRLCNVLKAAKFSRNAVPQWMTMRALGSDDTVEQVLGDRHFSLI